MNKIVWVMGESATGKKTFIQYAAANPGCELMRRLGYGNRKMVPIEESMKPGARTGIITAVLDLLGQETSAVFLLKWQAVDSIYGDTLKRLAARTLNVPQEIILLSVERSALYARVQQKCWWNDPALPASCYTLEQQDEHVTQIKQHAKEWSERGFRLLEIDSTAGYKIKK